MKERHSDRVYCFIVGEQEDVVFSLYPIVVY